MYTFYDSHDSLRMTRNRLLQRVTAPSTEPLTLTEAKLYLRVDGTDDDTLINDLIVAARMIAENWLKRSLITQSWKLSYDDGIAEIVELPMGPVNSITSLVVVNSDGSSQTISNSAYWLNAAQNALVLNSALMGFRIDITYATGYGSASSIPKPIKQGMLSHIAAMYDQRGEGNHMELTNQAIGLYAPFRGVQL